MRSTSIRMSIESVCKRIGASQGQSLYEDLSKPHDIPGKPTRNVNDMMDEFPS